ncbi:MAG: hypothetical protein ACRERD_08085, partial [Candidatus Binatia bacterium]
MADSVHFDLREVRALATDLRKQGPQQVLGPARRLLIPPLLEAERDMKRNVSGPVLRRRSGTLANSLGTEPPVVQGDRLVAHVGLLKATAAQRYGHFLIRGGTIRPRHARFLAIPLPAARTAAGVSRFPSPLRQSLAAAYPAGTFVAKGVLFGKLGATATGRQRTTRKNTGFGARAAVVPLFALKRSVTIKPHDYVS